jgi:3-phosphoshikimate 1-carboxyvinyltransferase
VGIKTTSKSITLPAKRPLKTMHQFVVEPDMSSAAFFLCLGAFSAKGIGMECKAKTRWQPDWIITSILSRMGVSILEQGNSLTAKSGSLHGIEQDLSSNPDLLPLLAILALFADSPSVFTGIAHLKFKESDRLKGMKKALTAIGANFEMTPESLKISPLQAAPPETKLNTQHDHRLVMAFTLIKLHYPQITLSETESVSKSCPEFFALLAKLK